MSRGGNMKPKPYTERDDATLRARLVIRDMVAHLIVSDIKIPQELKERAAAEIRLMKEE